MKRIISEALIVAVLGVLVALIANFVSPRGLSLTGDYFPARSKVLTAPPAATTPATKQPSEATSGVPSTSATPAVAGKSGIDTLTTEQALELFRDPQYEQELIVFIDARDDRHFQA